MGNALHHIGEDGIFLLRVLPLAGGGARVEVEDLSLIHISPLLRPGHSTSHFSTVLPLYFSRLMPLSFTTVLNAEKLSSHFLGILTLSTVAVARSTSIP